MSKCPQCNAEIDYLNYEWSERVWYRESYSVDGFEGDREAVDSLGEDDGIYRCPECEGDLAYNLREAEEILRNYEEELPGVGNPNNPNIRIRE